MKHRKNNLKALVDLVVTRADSLRRSTAYGSENRKEDRDIVQAKVKFVHRGLFIIRVVWEGLVSEMGVAEMLDRVEGHAGALQTILNDGRDQNTVLPEDVDFGDITDQLLVRAGGAVTKAASVSAGFEAVANGDDMVLPCTTASLKLVTALAKLVQYRVTSVSHGLVSEAVRLLLTMSSPGAAWPSSEGNPLFVRLRTNPSLAKKLAAALMRHFVSGPLDLIPPPEEEPSIVGDVWNVFKLPFQAALDLVAGEDELEPQDAVGLHGHSLRLLLVLGMDASFVPHQEMGESEDFLKAALAGFGDSDAAAAVSAAVAGGASGAAAGNAGHAGALGAAASRDDGRPFAVSYSSLYTSICGDVAAGELMHEEEALLLYFLVSTNMQFDRYLSSRADDLDQLMLPFLEILYRSPEFCIEQIYTQLGTLVLLTEMPDFNSCMCALVLPEVRWFDGPRALKDLSLGDLIMLVMLHVCLRNVSVDMDQYIHVSTMAVLANMSADFANMHAYAAQRLVGFYCHVSKLYMSVAPPLDQVEAGYPPPGSPKYELGLVVGTALAILNSCLSNRLRHNPNLIYTILVEKHHFAPPAHLPQSANELENINILIRHFEIRLDRSGFGENPSVDQVLTVIKAGAQSLPDSTLKKLPQMHLTFFEREDMHTFFLSFINELIVA